MVGGLGQRLGPRGDALNLSQDDPCAFCMRAGDTQRMVNFVLLSLFCVSHVIFCVTASCGAREGMRSTARTSSTQSRHSRTVTVPSPCSVGGGGAVRRSRTPPSPPHSGSSHTAVSSRPRRTWPSAPARAQTPRTPAPPGAPLASRSGLRARGPSG
eukprot:6953564-Prymnesium_polylepis.1